MDTHNKGVFALSIVTVLLAGCGGGGGGGGSSSATLGGFAGISHPTTMTLDSRSQEITYTAMASSASGPVDSINAPSTSLNSTVSITTDNTGDATQVAVQTPLSAINTSTMDAHSRVFTDYPDTDYGFNYQSLGWWDKYYYDTAESTAGAWSSGWETAAAAIPTSGSATYTGALTGIVLTSRNNSLGGIYSTFVDRAYLDADISASANFSNRSVQFSSSNSKTSTDSSNWSSDSSWNMAGTLSYASGTNAISGTLTTTGGISGTASGRFYGPNAEELGGTVGMKSGGTALVAAFGAKR